MVHEKNYDDSSSVRQKAHDGVDKIMDKAYSVEESGREEFDRLKEKAVMTRDNIDAYIQKNPEKSLLIAAGVGVVVGAILAAAMRKR